jgi:hypothetical protein
MPLTVDDLADHLNTSPPAPDTQQHREMQRALDTAVQETTRRTGMLDGETVTAQVSADSGVLRLPYVRLGAVGQVSAGGVVLTPTAVDLLTGLVDVGWTTGAVSVTCTGRPWPSALQQSALDWAAHLYDVQRAQTQPVDDDEPVPSFALPNRVEELQRPYLLPGLA